MKKLFVGVGILTVLIIFGGVFLLSGKDTNGQNTTSLPSHDIYFWSQTCPHCANVAEFMDSWDGKDKLELEKIEINESRQNTQLFIQTGTKICNIAQNQLGFPLLVTPDGVCYNGDEQIIDYLKSLNL